jgi:hypothetical protein
LEWWRRFPTAKPFIIESVWHGGWKLRKLDGFFFRHVATLHCRHDSKKTAFIIARLWHCEIDALVCLRAPELVLRCRLRALFGLG